MTAELITVGTAAAALTSALVAGITFAFSTSVMPALRRRPTPEGIAAMQAINSAILNPAFGLAFGAAALLCTLLALPHRSASTSPTPSYGASVPSCTSSARSA